ncbi:mechanosensitive ion channel family protein [Chondrinema litorale]|uniref:mechanosensitive ion channel family protein n=1 Tax=Chondrinema litorale TaxID=2994555 RepID=UPI002542B731|nr:mechanosensitive ion channel domain-containing protein [Chondrinema litorale]UZR95443.1 mechanosensitive ion channel [Chondrinema litorale]
MDNVQVYTEEAIKLAMIYVPKVVLAIVTLLIGFAVIKSIVNAVSKGLSRKEVDPSLQPFLKSLISALLKIALIITVASMVGIQTTSFVAVLGAAGLAVGLALQGSLSNFAGGVLILILKPFKVGDVITAQGFTAKVHEIQIFNTILKTGDNQTIILPNGPLANSPITNITAEPTRRVDFVFGIGYGDDIQKAKATLSQLIAADERIFKDPAPFIVVSELADSSVNLIVRVWCNAGDYWPIKFDMTENVKLTFDKEGISIPFPQVDAHIINEN